jgi:Coenzyme PQQ synthesis protein D (PqqD)
MFHHDYVPKRCWDIWRREPDSEIISVYDEFGRKYYLNPVASKVWDLVDGKRRVQEILDELAHLYPGVSPEVIDKSVEDLMARLETSRLIAYQEKSLWLDE